MFRRRLNKTKAQSILECTVMILILLAVFLTMQNYIKRGFQGRWKDAVDDFGTQYDPRLVNSVMTHEVISEGTTAVRTELLSTGVNTRRFDATETTDVSIGTVQIGSELSTTAN